MCACYRNEADELVVCDLCASKLIEALNAPTSGQVELTLFTAQECDEMEAAVKDYFASFQSGGR